MAAVALAAAVTAGPVSVARADGWSGSLGIVSDRVVRGITVSGGRAALLGSASYGTDGGWSAALEVAATDPAHGPRLSEVTASVGHGWQIDGDWSAQLGYAHYGYPPAATRKLSYDDIAATVDWQGRAFATVAVSPNVAGRDADHGLRSEWSAFVEAGWRERVIGRWTANVGVGHQRFRASRSGYSYGSVGLGTGWGPVQIDVTFVDSGAASAYGAPASIAGRRWVASAIWPF